MSRILLGVAVALVLASSAASAQGPTGAAEIVVTANKRRTVDVEAAIPAVGLRKLANFAVQEVAISGDTRDPVKRHEEIFAMIKGAIQLAQQRGNIELATGSLVVEPLTLVNYRNLALKEDDRPDSDQAIFLIKTRLMAGGDAKAALDRIDAFIKEAPTAAPS